MIRIQLPEAEAERLEALFRSTDDRKLRDRLQIVLLAHRGRTAPGHRRRPGHPPPHRHRAGSTPTATAASTGCGPRKAKGKPGQIPAALADEVRRWVIDGPAKQGLDRANWTHEELADHLLKTHGIRTSRSAVQRFCSQDRHPARTARPTATCAATRTSRPRPGRTSPSLKKKRQAGELVLLSQDEARFPMVPTLAATLGVKGHRPVVGHAGLQGPAVRLRRASTWSPAALHANTLESLQDGQPKRRARARPGGCRRRSPPTCGTSAGCTRRRSTSGWC